MLNVKFLLLLTGIALGQSICPQDCDCPLDTRGRRQVICNKGGMSDPIPIQSMDKQVEVIKISAPVDNPNSLTIGPIFQKFSQLEELHIVRSNVPAIGIHSFWGVPTIHVMNLTQNNISHILEYNFRGLINLLQLYLDDNRIESIPSGAFRYLHELRILSLSRNRIGELVPRIFLKLGKLYELNLSGNNLMELNPEVFKDVRELRIFKCRSCRLSNINTLTYRYLSDLVYLDLGENEFKYIASDEFHSLRKLQTLKLDGNQLPVVLEKTFGNLGDVTNKYSQGQVDLQELNLSRNRIVKVTTLAFANLTTLRSLDLSYNKLDKLETTTFLPLVDSLHSLNLSGNTIDMGELKHLIQLVNKVHELSLSDMSLTDIPLNLFIYHENLRFLNLSGNHLSKISPQVLNLIPKLQQLDLSRNKFRGLEERLLLRLEHIEVLNLRGNPWACDLCHAQPILDRINRTSMSSSLNLLTCKSPYALAGRTIESIQRSELRKCTGGSQTSDENTGAVGIPRSLLPHEAQLGLIAGVGAIVLFIITGITIGACIGYSRHRTNHYYTREDQRASTESEAIFENPTAVIDGNGEKVFKIPIEISKAKKKKVSIATIDEITKDPELHVLSNGT